jgi:3-hydroxyisobutyrate dehydrogenase-like beta-hydroxyacid dehydrogenase
MKDLRRARLLRSKMGLPRHAYWITSPVSGRTKSAEQGALAVITGCDTAEGLRPVSPVGIFR